MSELISSTNDVTDVNGMLSSSVGRRALQELRVAAAVEEVRRDERAEEQASDAMNTQIASLLLLTPVFVCVRVVGVRDDRVVIAGGDDGLRHQCASSVAGSDVQALTPNSSDQRADRRAATRT